MLLLVKMWFLKLSLFHQNVVSFRDGSDVEFFPPPTNVPKECHNRQQTVQRPGEGQMILGSGQIFIPEMVVVTNALP